MFLLGVKKTIRHERAKGKQVRKGMEEKKGGKGKAAERTKRWIAHAMKKLLEKKPLDKVHVTEICQLAEVERPTFYYYFKDKYDLMAWIFFQSAYNTDIISVDSAAESMDKMRDEYVFYKRAYEDNSQNAMWTYMHEYFVNRYTSLAQELSKEPLSDQIIYSIRFYCYGAVGMTREWLLTDTVSAKEVVIKMFHSMPESLRNLYFPVKTEDNENALLPEGDEV